MIGEVDQFPGEKGGAGTQAGAHLVAYTIHLMPSHPPGRADVQIHAVLSAATNSKLMPMKKLFFGETVEGWGVIRDRPFAFGGVYKSRDEAKQAASRLGPDYAVRYGQHRKGTCGFRLCAEPTDERTSRLTR